MIPKDIVEYKRKEHQGRGRGEREKEIEKRRKEHQNHTRGLVGEWEVRSVRKPKPLRRLRCSGMLSKKKGKERGILLAGRQPAWGRASLAVRGGLATPEMASRRRPTSPRAQGLQNIV